MSFDHYWLQDKVNPVNHDRFRGCGVEGCSTCSFSAAWKKEREIVSWPAGAAACLPAHSKTPGQCPVCPSW